MRLLYNIGIYVYNTAISIAAIFYKKAKLRYKGGETSLMVLKTAIDKNSRYIWIHAASLGEFEQGRPLIELIKEKYPQYKIVLSFFSPSGYEIRKHYDKADVVCYLPIDTEKNAKQFLDIIQPEIAIFIKYEFWANYLFELHRRNVKTYLVSSIFRTNQIFFRPYGHFFVRVLRCFTEIYVQDEGSRVLLSSIGINNVKVTGDTRFDRVCNIVKESSSLPIIESFCRNTNVIIAGSTWFPDEELLIKFINSHKGEMRMIIAPHEVSDSRIKEVCDRLECKYELYTKTNEESVLNADCLIIDTVGILSKVYKYGKIAYIGGGFGVGIHNTLEAAVWGMPVLWGPKYEKFKEAKELINCGGGKSINTYEQLEYFIMHLMNDTEAGIAAGTYVKNQLGATDKTIKYIFDNK